MKIVFLESAAQDIQWFRYYYGSVFPAGSAKARDKIKAIQAILAANPYAGHPRSRFFGFGTPGKAPNTKTFSNETRRLKNRHACAEVGCLGVIPGRHCRNACNFG